jgi:hypothetical protein
LQQSSVDGETLMTCLPLKQKHPALGTVWIAKTLAFLAIVFGRINPAESGPCCKSLCNCIGRRFGG